MPKPFWFFSSNSSRPLVVQDDVSWSYWITLGTIMENCTRIGGKLHSEQFQLDYLPPYSPELNPIERLWKLTRRKCLHNVHFEELSQVTDAVENQFIIWRNPN